MNGQPRARTGASAAQPPPPAQRWRLTFARERDPERRTHRELVDEWIAGLRASALPLPDASGRFRVPVTFAAPLPAGMACREELADLWLGTVLPLWRVREAIAPTLPARIELLRVDDVWVGAPALAAAVRAADYRVELPDLAPFDLLDRAAARMLAASSIERPRARGASTVQVDIRPLIESVRVSREPASLEIRTRFLPDRGAGRPEDVLAILGSWVEAPVEWGETVRERLLLADQGR